MSEKYTPFKMKGHELPGPNQSPAKKLGKNITHPGSQGDRGHASSSGGDPVYKKSKKVSRSSDYDTKGGKGR